jgi:hypothetical protein
MSLVLDVLSIAAIGADLPRWPAASNRWKKMLRTLALKPVMYAIRRS